MANLKQVARAKYSFSVDGGATGTIIPSKNTVIPKGAVITGCFTDGPGMTRTSSATLALSVGGITLKSATAVDSTDFTSLDTQLAVTTLNKTTASGPITMTVAGGTIASGSLNIFVEYTI